MLLVVALNDLNVQGVDIHNAFLRVPNKEKVWLKTGLEFGENRGKFYIVSRALYGLRSDGSKIQVLLIKEVR